ncbi:MAG: alanine--glyoxylate aminotransferase family protein, partial [Anaerolineae bacterium]|nr:alanine--glyoxylate aminotransferase family protein [Anaerolineae bacterium]MDW8072312.1 alanine--glyoxylate aminotransferase family protein [Anaerolineae bacterium]
MSQSPYVKIFIPGPVDVRPEILAAQTRPMIGHRSPEYAELQGRIIPRLRPIFGTAGRVFVVTASGSGLQEAAVRNCVRERCLSLVNGAFSQRWYEMVLANGKQGDALEVPPGRAVHPEQVDEKLRSGRYDAVTVVYNETSTGVFNPVPEIAAVVRRYPDVLLLVDAVSCAGGVEIKADEWGLDVCLTSSQKALALPPGLALCSVSDRAMERAKSIPHRGWYFDFLQYEKYAAKNHTPATPAISLMYALDAQLDAIAAEGWQNRFARHQQLMNLVHEWVREAGFDFFAEEGYRSPTVTCVTNTRGIDVAALNAFL